MRKLGLYILPIFFFGFIYYMFFNQIFQWKVYNTESENRTLAEFPDFDIKHLDNYPAEFETYLDDNFTYRKIFLKVLHEIKYRANVSPNEEDVIIGKDGFLFLTKESDPFNNQLFNKEEIERFIQIWNEREQYLDEKEIEFYWLIAPEKDEVFPELLPRFYRKDSESRVVHLQTAFNQVFDNKLVYPVNALKQDKTSSYYQHDNHWSEKGAFISYQEVMKRIKNDFPEVKEIAENDFLYKEKERVGGNLASFIGKDELIETELIADIKNDEYIVESPLYDIKMTEGFAYPHEYQLHYKNEKAHNPQKVLIIRDSFGNNIMKFFNHTFAETLYIWDAWNYGLNQEVIDLYQPDLIIYVSLETNIHHITENPAIIEHE